MQTYLIVFKSSKPAALITMIKVYTGWGKITEDAWVVTSYQSATQIRDSLLKVASPTDTIFVLRSGTVAAWSNVAASSDWLKKNL